MLFSVAHWSSTLFSCPTRPRVVSGFLARRYCREPVRLGQIGQVAVVAEHAHATLEHGSHGEAGQGPGGHARLRLPRIEIRLTVERLLVRDTRNEMGLLRID